tara:strand:+ start:797 stop:1048 length:252 start_codon:yes stop_codon:yes gene_type:complete
MSKFGYQPKPLLPDDHKEFLEYQRNLNDLLRQHLHEPLINKPKLEKENKKSLNSNNGKLRNRDGSIKSNVSQLGRRNPTPSGK